MTFHDSLPPIRNISIQTFCQQKLRPHVKYTIMRKIYDQKTRMLSVLGSYTFRHDRTLYA